MKNIIIKSAFALLVASGIAATANAQSSRFTRSENTLINFQLSQVNSGARLVIRNSYGQVVRSKSFFTNYCNIESSLLSSGNYTYTIINGNQVCEGAFSIR